MSIIYIYKIGYIDKYKTRCTTEKKTHLWEVVGDETVDLVFE